MKLIGKFHRFQKATAELFFDVPNSNTHAHEPPALELEPEFQVGNSTLDLADQKWTLNFSYHSTKWQNK